MRERAFFLGLAAALAFGACTGTPSQHDHSGHGSPAGAQPAHGAQGPDRREPVAFPAPLREHTLANMRDHLAVLAQIQSHLASGAFDQASEIAEARLGMSSLGLHEAHEAAKYMPAGMQAAGTAMHQAASRFAIVAKDASVTGDTRRALASLAELSSTCVACHAGYRLQ